MGFQARREASVAEEELRAPVDRVDSGGNVLKQYRSGLELCDQVGCEPLALWKHLKGKTPSLEGHLFVFRGSPDGPMTSEQMADLAEAQEGKFEDPLVVKLHPAAALNSALDSLSKPGFKSSLPKKIELNFQGIGDEGLAQLAPDLATAPVVELFLVKNGITDLGLACLADALKRNRSLTTLHLSDNKFTDQGLELLCASLADTPLRTVGCLVERRLLSRDWA